MTTSSYANYGELGEERNIGIDEIESISVTKEGVVVVTTSDGDFTITNDDHVDVIIVCFANTILDSAIFGTPAMLGLGNVKGWFTFSKEI